MCVPLGELQAVVVVFFLSVGSNSDSPGAPDGGWWWWQMGSSGMFSIQEKMRTPECVAPLREEGGGCLLCSPWSPG